MTALPPAKLVLYVSVTHQNKLCSNWRTLLPNSFLGDIIIILLLHNVALYSSYNDIIHGVVDGSVNWAFMMYYWYVIDQLVMVDFLQNETVSSCMQKLHCYPLKG